MVGALDEEASQVDVAGLRDPELRIAIARLTPSWSQTEKAADIPTSLEALFVPQGQHVGQCCNVTNFVDLSGGWVSGYSVCVSSRICRSYCLTLSVICAICSSTGPRACTSPGGMTARLRLAKHRVDEAGIRWPQAFISPRTALTPALRSGRMRSRARISVRASCCCTVSVRDGDEGSSGQTVRTVPASRHRPGRSYGRCAISLAAHERSPRSPRGPAPEAAR
jgi:hypothetical protein